MGLGPKGSYAVPLWVCYVFLVKDYNLLHKRELHRRFWVAREVIQGSTVRSCWFRVWVEVEFLQLGLRV